MSADIQKIVIPKIVNLSGHLHLQLFQGEFKKMNLKKNDIIRITIEVIK